MSVVISIPLKRASSSHDLTPMYLTFCLILLFPNTSTILFFCPN